MKKILIHTVALIVLGTGIFTTTTFWAPAVSDADVIWRKNGRKIEGTILREEEDRVLIRVKVGSIEAEHWIPKKEIDQIERGELASDEFDRRYAELDPADVKGHEALMEFARSKRLTAQHRMLKKKLPEVQRLQRIKEHPLKWCRGCESHGETSCAECNGSGKTQKACRRCKGEKVIRCRTCGHLKDRGKLRCRKCAGKGEYERFDPAKGEKVKAKCTACKGKGLHTCVTCGGKAEQECPNCKGSGGVELKCVRCAGEPHELCGKCGGTGLQRIALTEAEYAAELEAKKKAEAEAAEKAEKEAKDTGEKS